MESRFIELPPDKDLSISNSAAQNDADVFKLSFNGKNYMPFEGTGAISPEPS
jgi:hypothetical protein